MTTTLDVDLILASIKAARAVTCPKCKARPGEPCKSTGGGNCLVVLIHKAREKAVANWTPQQVLAARDLVAAQGRTWWAHLPDGYYAETESWAPPVQAAKPVTPRGVRLSELQAEEIEHAAELRDGKSWMTTTHFHGDHQHRQTILALEAKGILREVSADSDGRNLVLTVFGWQVYRQHRLIIRRLDDDTAAAFEAKAREQEQAVAA